MTKRVMVMGAGIAGPVVAVALRRAGLDPVLYEAHSEGADGRGAFLTLAENGLAALDVLGLGDPVSHLGIDTAALSMLSGRGKVLGTVPMRGRTVGRSDLYAVLRDQAAAHGVPIHYDKRLCGAQLTGAGVRAEFGDASTAEADLLVGADGVRSAVRTLIDPEAPAARHVGLLNTAGVATGVQVPGPPGVGQLVFGRRCFFGYFPKPGGEVWWFANPPSRTEPTRSELLAITSEQWRGRLLELFRDDVGPMRHLVGATAHVMPGWNTYDLPSVPHWHNAAMVLVGDAVHAAAPSSGQGASMAIEDAIVLAQCLRDIDDTPAALRTFTSLRRDRVERVVKHGRRSGSGKADGLVKAWFRDLMLPMVLRRVAGSGSLDWMSDYRLHWDTQQTADA